MNGMHQFFFQRQGHIANLAGKNLGGKRGANQTTRPKTGTDIHAFVVRRIDISRTFFTFVYIAVRRKVSIEIRGWPISGR